ncbi:MAG TPA: hypothetical protein VIC87_18190 [Vicinamibacteria bacterium]|jgi:hypothetical protein
MASPGARTARLVPGPSCDGRALSALAEIDVRLRELDRAWKGVALRLETSRRELAMAAVQLQRARSLAARRPRGGGDESDEPKPPAVAPSEEAHHVRLFELFEAELKNAEAERLAVHHETQGLRQRRIAALRQLPADVRSAYEAALQAGRAPVLTTMTEGACDTCASPLPPPVVEAVRRGVVRVCHGCERLLCSPP